MSHHGKPTRWDPDGYPPQLVLQGNSCPCCGKVSYPSRHAADSHVKRVQRASRSRGRTDSGLHPYECPQGHGWHLGHAASQGRRTQVAPLTTAEHRRNLELLFAKSA